jgi:hypothetical protein
VQGSRRLSSFQAVSPDLPNPGTPKISDAWPKPAQIQEAI